MSGVSSGGSGGGVSGDDDAPSLDAAQRACCFQLYGFDVMLDADAKPWLLEVNGDPGLRTESPVFLEINAPMVSDLLNLVGLSAPAAASSAGDDTISGPGVSRVERLREEAVSRHARGKENCGRWRRLEPSARSAEWASLLDEVEGAPQLER